MSHGLAEKHCVPCEGGALPFNADTINRYLSHLHAPWQITDNKKMSYQFTFKQFKQAMDFVNRVAACAEAEGHHPDLHIVYNKVLVELTTHAIGGLSENDFILARKIELLYDQHPHS